MKKVLFVCGSLEPGHDGVGDYTRELAGALQKIGLDTKIIGIRDRKIENVLEENQPSREQDINVLRLSKNLSFSKRRKEYLRLIADYKPDWISLQYVPYAFSSKGIPLRLTRFLYFENKIVKWHFMIHESYIVGNLGFKDQFIQRSQIFVIKSLERNLNPALINTSTPQYQSHLSAIGVKSEVLGLFGNIQINPEGNSIQRASSGLQGVFFGSGPIEERFSYFLKGVREYINSGNHLAKIVFSGRPDYRTSQFIRFLKSNLKDTGVLIEEKGELEMDELSKLFLESHFGISREPPITMGKSGSVIALLEHGLPLWVPLAKSQEDIVSAIEFRADQCFFELREISDNKLKFDVVSRLDEIACDFKNELLNVNNLSQIE